jgi:hypothetical protein
MFPRVGQQECHQGPAVDRNYADCVLLPRADDSEAGLKKKKKQKASVLRRAFRVAPSPSPTPAYVSRH